MAQRFPGFGILELPPTAGRRSWVYATCGMSSFQRTGDIELHLHAPGQLSDHVETLTAIAHFHLTSAVLGLGHTVRLGRPWIPQSSCDHGLISLPYLDGPALENCTLDGWSLRCLWLVPITAAEVAFKQSRGLEALEALFESKGLDYANPGRRSVI